MVISATRTARRLEDVPVSVSVIERPRIESAPVRNVDDLLITEPGVSVKRVVGMGEGIPSDIIVRGVPGAYAANRLLVLVDGIPTNVSGTPFMILNLVPMESIERVELVRGPFSSLYGANAFSGVLNIITRQAQDDPFALTTYLD
jgi:outer membrane cobalamin receptor